MAVRVSLVVPAYDEAVRLRPHLLSIRDCLSRNELAHEVIVVDDGSRDGTAAVVAGQAVEWPQLVLLRHDVNRGKGQALRTGVAAARGDFVLLADADGATPIAEEAKLRRALLDGADIAIGSRIPSPPAPLPACEGRVASPHPQPLSRGERGATTVQRSWVRNLTGAGFGWAVRHLFDLPIGDTQCGFKMFRREVAQRLFGMCRETGYLIDLEVLLHAQRLGYQIAEVPVAWRDVPGSKVRLVRDGWRMLCGLWRLRRVMREYRFTAETPRPRAAKAEMVVVFNGNHQA